MLITFLSKQRKHNLQQNHEKFRSKPGKKFSSDSSNYFQIKLGAWKIQQNIAPANFW